jgi:hypothetical protein
MSYQECIVGETAYGCPTFCIPKLATNTYCIQCMECVKPARDNLASTRPGFDLVTEERTDEAHQVS